LAVLTGLLQASAALVVCHALLHFVQLLLASYLPNQGTDSNELPDQPVLLR
jgi:uncharacterized membrane protein